MPTSVVVSYAHQSGKTVAEVEQIWEEAKAQADGKFKNHDDNYWRYVNSITKNRCGLKDGKDK